MISILYAQPRLAAAEQAYSIYVVHFTVQGKVGPTHLTSFFGFGDGVCEINAVLRENS